MPKNLTMAMSNYDQCSDFWSRHWQHWQGFLSLNINLIHHLGRKLFSSSNDDDDNDLTRKIKGDKRENNTSKWVEWAGVLLSDSNVIMFFLTGWSDMCHFKYKAQSNNQCQLSQI